MFKIPCYSGVTTSIGTDERPAWSNVNKGFKCMDWQIEANMLVST